MSIYGDRIADEQTKQYYNACPQCGTWGDTSQPCLGCMAMNKYKACKTEVDGKVFDSKKEATRYGELKLLERGNAIDLLELQPQFEVVVNGVLVCKYRGDFRYRDRKDGALIVEDVKGMRTPLYRLKKKLVEAQYGIRIVEI